MSLYQNASALTGPLQSGMTVQYRRVFSTKENVKLGCIVALNVLVSIVFLTWLAWPSHWPKWETTTGMVGSVVVVGLMLGLEIIRLAQCATLMFFASRAKDPIPMHPNRHFRVAVLTTIVPGKEPFELVFATLLEMLKIRHNGVMDVWLLDEGNDPYIKAVCEANGINHFSRKDRPEYNTKKGAFKAKTKHGNHNAWRAEYEDRYDLVAQMDPDHIPSPDFLERSVGYFNDPDVAFVVAPQVYGNIAENWIAHGAAFLAYIFHAVIQRGGNGLSAPLLIGTNHVYRVLAFKQIGGYQDSIIEDHLTSMKLFATRNWLTNNYWKGVYTPDILAVGEGPQSFTDWNNQQKRWAYGIWEIIFGHSPELFGKMATSQRLSFAMLQMFYPSVAVSWIMSIALNAVYLFSDMSSRVSIVQWALLWGSSFGLTIYFFMWLRRFNLVEHERKDNGLIGMALMLMTIPVYTAAAIRRCTGQKLAYAVTAKGSAMSPDNIRTFTPHLMWAVPIAGLLSASFAGWASPYFSLRFWLIWSLLICLAPVGIHYTTKLAAALTPAPLPIPVSPAVSVAHSWATQPTTFLTNGQWGEVATQQLQIVIPAPQRLGVANGVFATYDPRDHFMSTPSLGTVVIPD